LKDEESERQAQRQIEVNQAKPVRTKRDIVTGTVNGQPLTLLKDDATKEMTTLSGEPVSPEVLDAFVPTPKTQPHQLSPAVQYMNLTTKKILAEKKQGPPLTPEESAQLAAAEGALTLPGIARMQALAKYQAENNTALVTDDEGLDVLATRAQAVHAAEGGHPMLSGKVGEPTGKEKDRQDFCDSALLQVNTMRDIIKRNKGLFGPGAGRVQEFAAWVGSSSPDAQRFRTSALILADHSAGVFGGRSVETVDELKDVITSMNLTPEALLAGLAQDEATFNKLRTATGRLPAPEATPTGGAHKLGEKKQFRNGKTGVWDGAGWVAQ
jgi:hypothetical protein